MKIFNEFCLKFERTDWSLNCNDRKKFPTLSGLKRPTPE